MSGTTRDAAKVVAEKVTDAAEEVVDDTVETVSVSKEWLEDITARLERAERPVLVKVKDVVVTNRRKLALAGTTVLALSAAAYVVTHRDEVFEGLEHATEATAETVELGAQSVKKDARKARTGSTTK